MATKKIANAMHKLTTAEAEVLCDLHSGGWTHGAEINPSLIYPCRDNADNAKRRTITRLYKKGILKKHPNAEYETTALYSMPPEASSLANDWCSEYLLTHDSLPFA